MFGQADEADRVNHRAFVNRINSHDPITRLQEVIRDRFEESLAQLQLAGLRLVQQRDEVDLVFLGRLLHVGLIAGNDQPHLAEVLLDGGKVERHLGEDHQGLGVVFDGDAPRGDQQTSHLLRDFDALPLAVRHTIPRPTRRAFDEVVKRGSLASAAPVVRGLLLVSFVYL